MRIELLTIIDMMNEVFEAIYSGTEKVSAEDLGLDARAGGFIVGEDFICPLNNSNARYYGGLEYVSPDHITYVGSYTLYSIESDRVAECINFLEQDEFAGE